MQIGLLGPLEVRVDGGAVEVSGRRLRTLLALLALAAPRAVSSSTLVQELWGDEPPGDAANSLQSLVSRLRRALGGGDVVQQAGAGYRLAVEPADVDTHRFARLAGDARAALRSGDAAAAAIASEGALGLWRGDPADLPDDARLSLEQQAQEARADLAEATLGTDRAVSLLEQLVAEQPLRERYAELLVRALHAAGRPAEALAAYGRAKEHLAEELGVDPSPELQAAQLAVLRSEPVPRAEPVAGNLRATLTTFVGREAERAQVLSLLGSSRLVTLVGPGGAGKTRLALAAAAAHGGAVWVAEFAPVADAADLAQAVLGAIGVRDQILIDRTVSAPRDPLGRLVDALAARKALLVLDNCEHLIEAVAQLADQLLAACPSLRILATSREPLAIFGEALVALPPLDLPATGASADEAAAYASVQLFADRARDAQPGFAVDEATAGPVVEIVRRLDGLPLAIELAAARLRSLPVAEVERRLADRFRLLTGGSRTAMPRHRTLHAVVQWSWDLLSADEQELAQRLAVFAGGISAEAAAAVAPGLDTEELLAALVDKSLLQTAPPVNGRPRYRMLETIREFGLERMGAAGIVGEVRLAHADHFRALVAEADPHLRTRDQLPWFALLAAERDNVLAALKFFGDTGRAEECLALVGQLGWHWMTIGNHDEIVTWVSFALAVPGDVDPVNRLLAETFLAINTMAWAARGLDITDRMAQLRRDIDAIVALAESGKGPAPLALLAPVVAMFTGDDATAERLTQQAMGHEDPWVAAAARMFHASMAENVGDLAQMRIDSALSLQAFRAIGERWGLANCLQGVGVLAVMDGDLEQAYAYYEEALGHAQAIGSREDVASMRMRLADIDMRLGDLDGALRQADLGRVAVEDSGSPAEEMLVGMVRVEIARVTGKIEQAVALRDETVAMLRRLPGSHPVHGHGMAVMLAAGAKVELDRGDLAAAWQALDEAYDRALETRDMPIVAAVGVAVALVLSGAGEPARAAEVLGAAAQLRGAEDRGHLDIVRLAAELGGLDDGPHAEAYSRGRATAREGAIARADPRQARLL